MDRVLRLEACEVDLDRRIVLRDGKHQPLTEQEAGLLEYLAARPGQPVSREELLREVWGFTGRNLITRAVDVAVRRLRQKLEADASRPSHVLTLRGVGYRFEGQPSRLMQYSETPGPAPTRQKRGGSGHVPSEQSRFVGRETELAFVHSALTTSRLVTIVGPGGVGKTRLATRIGNQRRAEGETVWFVDLSAAETKADLIRVVAETLKIPLTHEEGLNVSLRRILERRGAMLVILDNFEQLVDTAPTIAEWLVHDFGARFLVTTRERLRLDAEVTLVLEPLEEDEARELFLDRARAVRRDYGDGEDEAIGQIVGDLDGIPLALELAAARARVLPPRMLLEGLTDRFRLLSSGARGASERQATLFKAIDWSWSLLDEFERSALAQCSVFHGGFGVQAAGAVVQLDAGAPWVLDWLQALVEKSLVRAIDSSGEARFALLESQRQFARAMLEEAGDVDAVEKRHRDHYLSYGAELAAAFRGEDGERALHRLALEADNLRSVHRRAHPHDPETVVRSALILDPLLDIRGPIEERLALLNAALSVPSNPRDRARAHLSRGWVFSVRAEPERAADDAETALIEAREARDVSLEGRIQELRSWLLGQRSEYSEAAAAGQSALSLAQQSADRFAEGMAHNKLGHLAAERGDYDAAEVHYRQMREIGNDLRAWRMQVQARCNLGLIARTGNRFDEAEQEYQTALAMAREMGDAVREATVLGNLAALASARGHLDEAVERFGESLALHRAAGNRRLETMALGNYGILLMCVGRLREARNRLVEALRIADARGNPRHRGMLEGNLGVCQIQLGELKLATLHLSRGCELLAEWGTTFAAAYFSAHLAAAAADLDELAMAEAALERAESGLIQVGEGHPVAEGLLHVVRGHVALARGRVMDEPARRSDAEAELARAQALAEIDPDDAFGNAMNTVLPSELNAAIRNLERALEASQ